MDEQEAFKKLLKMHQDAKRVRIAYLVQLAQFAYNFKYKREDVEKMVERNSLGF